MNLKKMYKAFSLKGARSNAPGVILLTQDKIEQLHVVLLDIVDDIMDVCDQEQLTCLLGGGSALGAIRHHGFIPWDDDIDINMPRDSFDRFVPAFKKKYGEKYWVHTPADQPQFGVPMCKVRRKGTRLKTNGSIIDDSEAGIFVDIFVIENIYDNRIKRLIQGILANLCKVCMSCRKFYRDRKTILASMVGESIGIAFKIRLIIGFLCSFMSVEKWTILTNNIFSMCKNNTTKQVSIPSGRWHYFGSIHDRDTFCKTKKVLFEGRMYPICIGIEEYLTQLYGINYMQVPPPEKREEHVCWECDLGEEYRYLQTDGKG